MCAACPGTDPLALPLFRSPALRMASPQTSARQECPSCRSQDLTVVGPIPASDLFAGRRLAEPLAGGSMVRCNGCTLSFRDPRLDKDSLDALYRAGGEEQWIGEQAQDRPDWRLAGAYIADAFGPAASVLDAGCFDGAFLASLPGGGPRCGIEIHPGAAARAGTRGVRILGADFEALDAHPGAFDVVTAFDVIEHVEDPLRLLRSLYAATRAGGAVILSTGNAEALSWRLLKGRYWYCAIPEHLSFLNPRWCRDAARRLGGHVDSIQRFSHDARGGVKAATELAANLLYGIAPPLFRALRGAGVGRKDVSAHPALRDAPPRWITARDHMLVVIAHP